LALDNLKAEATRIGIKQQQFADLLQMSLGNINLKINGKVDFTNTEMRLIRSVFFPNLSIDYLFADDGDTVLSKDEEAHANIPSREEAVR